MDPTLTGIQGEESDYLLQDGLLGHQFTFEKFESSPAARVSRRHVLSVPSPPMTTTTNKSGQAKQLGL